MADKKLTERQLRFIAAYDGNGTQAAKAAGFPGNDNVLGVTANRLLRNSKVKAAIKKRMEKKTNKLIATREERQAFWTEIMKKKGAVKMSDRLRASELLGKSEADFTEIQRHEGKDGGPIVVVSMPGNESESDNGAGKN